MAWNREGTRCFWVEAHPGSGLHPFLTRPYTRHGFVSGGGG